MADKHIADGEPGFKAASSAPDVCMVGGSAVPFDSFQDLSKQKSYVDSVKARGKHLLTVGSVIAGSLGNAGSGVVSGTSQGSGDCTILTGANKVKAEGKPIARHLSDVAMNNGNTLGKLYTQSGQANGTLKDNRHPCNDPPKRSETLDKLEAFKQDLENNALNANRLDQYMRLDEKGEMLQGGIDTIRPGQDSPSFTQGAAGATRATLGFLKDTGLGIGQLAYAAAKRLSPVNKTLDQVNALILAENIRLGNVCMGQIGEQAKAMGQAIVKPVTDPWAKGDYAESVTRGGLELVTLLLPFTKLGKAGELANAAGKLGEAEKIGEGASVLGKAGEVQKATEAGSVLGKTVEVEKTGEAVNAAGKVGGAEKAIEVTEATRADGSKFKVFMTTMRDGVKIKARSLRELFLGRTPGKKSKTGKEVIERMRNENPPAIREGRKGMEFRASDNEWYPVKYADMAHQQDAVKWWNAEGRNYGARSPEVKSWMKDPNNYRLDYYKLNRSAGASLPDRYLPPTQ